MADIDKIANRLALLEGVNLSQDDLEAIGTELQDIERVVAELEEFGQSSPWVALQVQPSDKKV